MLSTFPVRKVLVYNRNLEFVRRSAELELRRQPKLNTGVVGTISHAVEALVGGDMDAIVLHVDGSKEMSHILRVRRAAPKVPILALVPDLSPTLDILARQSGADSVLASSRNTGEALDVCARALSSIEDLIQRVRIVVEENRALGLQLQASIARLKTTFRKSFDLASIPAESFVPLLVEDSRDDATLLKRAFADLGLPFRLPVVHDAEEAIAYLSGQGEFADRARYPLPTIVITDLHLPKGSGLEVIEWVRANPALAGTIIFMLSSSSLSQDFQRALSLGADSYFMKPQDRDVLREMAGVMAVRWGLLFRSR